MKNFSIPHANFTIFQIFSLTYTSSGFVENDFCGRGKNTFHLKIDFRQLKVRKEMNKLSWVFQSPISYVFREIAICFMYRNLFAFLTLFSFSSLIYSTIAGQSSTSNTHLQSTSVGVTLSEGFRCVSEKISVAIKQ